MTAFDTCPRCGSRIKAKKAEGKVLRITRQQYLENPSKYTEASRGEDIVEIMSNDGKNVLATLGWGDLPEPTEADRKLDAQIEKELGFRFSPESPAEAARKKIEEWAAKQSHDKCWYYPDIFKEVAEALGAKIDFPKGLPSREEFEEGCRKYQDEQYGPPKKADADHPA